MNVWQSGVSKPLGQFLENPGDLSAIQSIYECYSNDILVQKAVEKNLFKDPRFKELFESWYTPTPFSIDELLRLPVESFGYLYATHMKVNNLDVNFISPFKEKNVLSYLWLRAGHVHDVCHIMSGFDTTFMGELGLKGFELGQYLSASTAAILGGGLLAVTSRQPELVEPIFDMIVEGYVRGKKFPLLTAIKWDQEWKTPLSDLKRKYQIPTV